MCAVAWAAHALIPGLPWEAAFVLGALVSPTRSRRRPIMRRLEASRRLVGSIEGEGLFNDATALVTYRVAVSAVVAGSFVMGGSGRTTSLFSDFPGGVPRDLSQVAIRVLKVARVPSIKGIVSILYNDRSCLARLLHYLIDFFFRRHVLSKREFCWT